MAVWNGFLRKKVHLIACGGTAMTLLGVKSSTKDVDFLVPDEEEYWYLIKIIEQLGYEQKTGSGWERAGEHYIFDLFKGKRVHTTELLDSPLENEKHSMVKEFSYLYIGVLNYYDLIVSKLFRGTGVDFEDCLMLARNKQDEIDFKILEERFRETAQYEIAEQRVLGNLEHFVRVLKKEGLYGK
ncbi:MAG: hypothetical protein HQL26_04945 [Candidatus Omnitrophica bacterium]|nr:hypothetical protein [Candidatus Omnitrophota bacterium]